MITPADVTAEGRGSADEDFDATDSDEERRIRTKRLKEAAARAASRKGHAQVPATRPVGNTLHQPPFSLRVMQRSGRMVQGGACGLSAREPQVNRASKRYQGQGADVAAHHKKQRTADGPKPGVCVCVCVCVCVFAY